VEAKSHLPKRSLAARLEASSVWLLVHAPSSHAHTCGDGDVRRRTTMQKVAKSTRVSGGGSLTGRYATPAEFPLHDSNRTGGNAYDVGVWDLSIVQGPCSVAPKTLTLRFITFASQYAVSGWDKVVSPWRKRATAPDPRRHRNNLRGSETQGFK
jgi:hypothetical protein